VTTYRFTAVASALFFLSYAILHWMFGVGQSMPSARMPSFHQVATSDDPRENREDPTNSDSDEVRDGLRRGVQSTANNLISDPCNGTLRDQYIVAATKYAHAWLSIAPCYRNCSSQDWTKLELAQKAFNTPFDKTVRDLMRRVHNTGTIREGDFAPGVAGMVARMSGDPLINPDAELAVREITMKGRSRLACRS
jgi:hypothetical protein